MAADGHAHKMLDQPGPGQIEAVVRLLEVMTDPVSHALANAPFDDEPFTEEDRQAVAEVLGTKTKATPDEDLELPRKRHKELMG